MPASRYANSFLKNMQLNIQHLCHELINEILNEKSNYIIEPFLDPLWTNNWWENIGKYEHDEIKYLIFTDNNQKLVVPLVTRKYLG